MPAQNPSAEMVDPSARFPLDNELGADNFRHLAEAVPQITWTANPNGEVDYLSPQFYIYSGVSQDSPDALNWLCKVHPDDADGVVSAWENSVDRGIPYEHQIRIRSASGDYMWFATKAVPVIGEGGKTLKWYGVSTEIDQQKRDEIDLLEAAEQKDRFIAMLGHELRNPLATISTSYDSLSSNKLSESRREVVFSLLGRQIKHLKRLVDDTLDISRLKSGRMDLIVGSVEVNALVNCCFEDYRKAASEHGLEFKIELKDEEIWVDGDEVRLAQCLSNLVSNAIKFTESGGTVILKAGKSADGRSAEIEIRDSGIGMAQDQIGTLFMPFEQGDEARLLSKDGLGLGLAIVEQLVKMHQGEVTGKSAGRNQGTTFVIRVPLGITPDTAQATPTEDSEPAGIPKKARVLVIEDNTSVACALQILLELDGHQVSIAPEGKSALEALEKEIPHVVFCDLSLPGDLMGWDIAEAICERIDQPLRPYLVALSGHTQQDYVDKSIKAGFDRHVAKPPEPDVLRECIRVGLAQR